LTASDFLMSFRPWDKTACQNKKEVGVTYICLETKYNNNKCIWRVFK